MELVLQLLVARNVEFIVADVTFSRGCLLSNKLVWCPTDDGAETNSLIGMWGSERRAEDGSASCRDYDVSVDALMLCIYNVPPLFST